MRPGPGLMKLERQSRSWDVQGPREEAGLRGLDIWMGGRGQEVRALQVGQESRLGRGEV